MPPAPSRRSKVKRTFPSMGGSVSASERASTEESRSKPSDGPDRLADRVTASCMPPLATGTGWYEAVDERPAGVTSSSVIVSRLAWLPITRVRAHDG